MNDMRKSMLLARLFDCTRGAATVEFAIIAGIFISLLFGVLSGSMLLWSEASLHYATESAARCFSINAASCPDTSTTQKYALGKYLGPNSPIPTFIASTPACGHEVNGSLKFVFKAVLVNWNVPLSATACFP